MRGFTDTSRVPCRPGGARRTGVLASVLLTAFALAGCESAPKAGVDGEGGATSQAAAKSQTATKRGKRASGEDDDAPSAQALALREQADRDMEALRTLRREARGDAPAAEAEESPGNGPTPSGRRPATRGERGTEPGGIARVRAGQGRAEPARAILWNDPGAVAANGTDTPPDQVLARPEASMTVAPFSRNGETLSASEQIELDTLSMRLVQLRQDLYRESIDSEQPVRELLAIAAMAIVNPDLKLPQGTDRSLTPEEVELLEQLHRFFIALGQKLDDQHEAEKTIVDAVLELQKAIVKKPQLELPATELCWRIGGFGDYDRFERNVFLAHDEQQVILYLEIDGFTSTLNEREQWVTEISQQLEIFSDRDGIPVWSESWQKAVDVINKKRRDFFTTQLITLPLALSVGKYHLKIRVRDEQSGAEAEESITFEMVADPKMAAPVGR